MGALCARRLHGGARRPVRAVMQQHEQLHGESGTARVHRFWLRHVGVPICMLFPSYLRIASPKFPRPASPQKKRRRSAGRWAAARPTERRWGTGWRSAARAGSETSGMCTSPRRKKQSGRIIIRAGQLARAVEHCSVRGRPERGQWEKPRRHRARPAGETTRGRHAPRRADPPAPGPPGRRGSSKEGEERERERSERERSKRARSTGGGREPVRAHQKQASLHRSRDSQEATRGEAQRAKESAKSPFGSRDEARLARRMRPKAPDHPDPVKARAPCANDAHTAS